MTRVWFFDFGAVLALLWAVVALLPAGSPAAEIDAVVAPPEAPIEAMRTDLAERLDVDAEAVRLLRFADVTWPDACAGATGNGRVCAQVLQQGFIARFEVGDRIYRYHGAGSTFKAVSFGGPIAVGQPVAGVAIQGLGVSPLEP